MLNITDTTQDDILNLLITNATNYVTLYLDVIDLPSNLSFVIEEMVVVRYNKLQTEGLQTSFNEGKSFTYSLLDLNPYKDILDKYTKTGNRLKML
jgi:hypothetical protein